MDAVCGRTAGDSTWSKNLYPNEPYPRLFRADVTGGFQLWSTWVRAEDDERFQLRSGNRPSSCMGWACKRSVSVPTPSGSLKESPRCGRGRTLANETRGMGTRESVLCVSRELDRFESRRSNGNSRAIHSYSPNEHSVNNAMRCRRGIASKQTLCVCTC
jgi:hypothetical protein